MKKLVIYLLLLQPFVLRAQQNCTGLVKDRSGNLLDGVTISLSQNHVNLLSLLTDSGRFTISRALKGTFTITATQVGYKSYTGLIELPKDSLMIIVQNENKTLAEVQVSSRRPLIERKVDRVVFNVENSIVATGGSAWEALAKAPGVQLSTDGTITANKKSVLLFIDDKPVRLGADELSNYLQSLSADAIARIEVFSNPPARFDAQGGSVINIVTKKSSTEGLNLNLNSGFTVAAAGSYRAGMQFNYRKNKLNLYGSYSYSNSHKKYAERDYIGYNTPTSSSFWDSDKNQQTWSSSSTYKLGIDYQLSAKALIGLLVTGYNRSGHSNTSTSTTVLNNRTTGIDSVLQTTAVSKPQASQYSYNLNYSLKLDTTGRNLDINIDYLPYRNQSQQMLDNYATLPGSTDALSQYHILTPATQNIDIYSGKVDYTSDLGKKWNLTSGLKYSTIRTANDFNYFNNTGQVPIPDESRSDHFKYAENTAAAYTSVSGAIGKWSLSGGLRAEYTSSKGVSALLDTVTKRNYLKFFPTAYALYQVSDAHELQFSYSYRIERPEYFRLNPAKSYVTPFSFVTGNPLLQPSFVQSIELGYTYEKKYNVTVYYQVVHDLFTYITEQDNVNNLLLTTQKNLGLSASTGVRLSAPFQPTRWWDMNATADLSYQTEKSAYLEGSYDYHKVNVNLSLDQSFSINKAGGWKAELNSWYHGPQISGILTIARTYDVSAGIRKTFLNGQGTIRLSAGDVFYGNAVRVASHYLSQNNGIFMKQDTRNLTLGLTYKLGKNVKDARSRRTSSEEEKKRAQ